MLWQHFDLGLPGVIVSPHLHGVAGIRQSSDRPGQGWTQPDGSKQNQKPLAGTSDRLAVGGGALVPPPAVGSTTHGGDFSPSSDSKSGKGGGQVAPAGSTKTIQSYFFKPSNGTAVQHLAASYGTGELAGQSASVLPKEYDLSGADGDSCRGEPSHAQPMARVGRSGSTGTIGGGGEADGKSMQHRFSHAVQSVGEQGVSQAQPGHPQAQSRTQAIGLAGACGGSTDDVQTGLGQARLEKLQDSLREAKALEIQLRKELDRVKLERGSMETMVGRAMLGRKICGVSCRSAVHLVATGVLPLIGTPSFAAFFVCVMQADTLRNQLDQTMEEFRTKETDRDAQKKQLTSVIEGLLRKVHFGCVASTLDCLRDARNAKNQQRGCFFRSQRFSPVLGSHPDAPPIRLLC